MSSAAPVVNCAVCLEEYTETSPPYLLLCAHSFCESCLTGLLKPAGIECPKCRAVTPVPNRDEPVSKTLKKNFDLLAVLPPPAPKHEAKHDREVKAAPAATVSAQCEECKVKAATLFCTGCNAAFCVKCVEDTHKGAVRILQKHQQVPLDQYIPHPTCKTHAGKHLVMAWVICVLIFGVGNVLHNRTHVGLHALLSGGHTQRPQCHFRARSSGDGRRARQGRGEVRARADAEVEQPAEADRRAHRNLATQLRRGSRASADQVR